MRREPRIVAAAAPAAARPSEWGHLMRREPRTAVPGALHAAGEAATAPAAARPPEWGHLMRREPRLAVPAALSTAGEALAKVLPATPTMPPTTLAHGFVFALVAFGALTGFAVQAKNAVGGLYQIGAKGKAK